MEAEKINEGWKYGWMKGLREGWIKDGWKDKWME